MEPLITKIDTMEATSKTVANEAPASKNWSADLHRFLDTVEPLGSFATFGVLNKSTPMSHPKVTVRGVGTLVFPLTDLSVEAVKVEATRAPFGQGAAMWYNEAVRKSWQIDAAKVTLEGGDDQLQSVVIQSCQQMGFSKERIVQLGIHARLYKFMLYETGGHFVAHRDTEKEAGMFGTLIIQLPSKFTGGALTVSHQGETKTSVQESDGETGAKYIAFYSDCEHQLHPVKSGVRVCLVFNLICAAPTAPRASTHTVNIATETMLQSMAHDWTADKSARPELGYSLGYHYTPQSFGIKSLKGHDDVVCQTLLNAQSTNGKPLFEIHLLLLQSDLYSRDDVVISRLCLDRDGVLRDCDRRFCKDSAAGWYWTWNGYRPYGENDGDEKMATFAALQNGGTIKQDDNERKGYEDECVPSSKDSGGPDARWYYAAAIVISPTSMRSTANKSCMPTLRRPNINCTIV
jgi:predicted 2-oxoglutarate/Fe(II)-dependent dioxygenase YbiX